MGWLAMLLLGCTANTTPEARISSLIHDWFDLLEARTEERSGVERFLAEPSFELTGADGQVLGIAELRARLSELHSTYVQVEHQIDEIRIEAAGDDGLYRARFEVERQAVDAAGTPHLARKEANWLVRAESHAAPVILRIEERPLLAYPGMGPRIVCY